MAPGKFQLRLEPEDFITFKSDYIFNNFCVSIKLTNITEKRQLIKVKATSTTLYQVKPVLMFLHPNESTLVKFYYIGRQIPEAGSPQYFDLYHRATEEVGSPKDVWNGCEGEPDGFHRMNVKFLKSDGSEWPPLTPAPLAPLFDWKWRPQSLIHTAIPEGGTHGPTIALDPTQLTQTQVLSVEPTQMSHTRMLTVDATQLSRTQCNTLPKTSSPTLPLSAPTSSKRCSVDPRQPINVLTTETAPPPKLDDEKVAERLRGEIALPSMPPARRNGESERSGHSNTTTSGETTTSHITASKSTNVSTPTKSLGGNRRY